MALRLKLEELKKGLKLVFALSACLLAGLITGFALVCQALLTTMPNLTGLATVVAVGLLVVYVGVHALLVVVDSAFALMNPKYFANRGLEACA